jgi:hypothetical protein
MSGYSLGDLARSAYLLVWLLAVGAGESDRGDKAKADQDRIQGTWECIATPQNGKQVEKYVEVRAAMQGDRLTWTFPEPGRCLRPGQRFVLARDAAAAGRAGAAALSESLPWPNLSSQPPSGTDEIVFNENNWCATLPGAVIGNMRSTRNKQTGFR